MSFQVEQSQNEQLRKTPEINFNLKSRPKHSGFVSQSGKKAKTRKLSSLMLEDNIKKNDF